MRHKKSSSSSSTSLETILIYFSGAIFFLYLILTIVTFQNIAPLPENLYLPSSVTGIQTNDHFRGLSGGGGGGGISSSSSSSSSSNGGGGNKDQWTSDMKAAFAFPQSIHDAPMENITHPAVEIVPELQGKIPNLIVPKFFDPPVFQKFIKKKKKGKKKKKNNGNGDDNDMDNGEKVSGIRSFLGNYGEQLMTLKQAQQIGSHDANGRETIFVAIASYRDFQCRQTIESVLSRATYPERIRVAVVDQYDYKVDAPCSKPEKPCEDDPDQILCKYKSQIDFYEMEAQFAMGPVFARHLGNRMYRGEYYAVQCDAHVDFIKDWDTDMISQWKSAKNEMAVLTAYLSDVHDSLDAEGNLLRKTRPIMCKSDWEGYGVTQHMRHGQQPEGPAGIKGEPTLEPYWAAGYSFSRGHFIVNVPYDQHLPWVFQGEEISIGLRGFTYGYDYYTPETSVCFHYYAKQDGSGKRDKVKLFWENTRIIGGSEVRKIEQTGMKRLNGILNINNAKIKSDEWIHLEEKFYGVGKARTTQKFYDTFGIDVAKRKTEDHLCRFVGKNMQLIWKPHLRSNTMGIDYSGISYRFKDPDVHGNTWQKLLPKKNG